MASTKVVAEDRETAINTLIGMLKAGDTVYTVLRHCSSSGMSRRISPVIILNGKPEDISYTVAKLGIWKRRYPNEGLVVSGCGMDMGFHVVYEMSRVLFPDGFGVVGEASLYPKGVRPATKEQADSLRSKGVTFHGRNGDGSGWDTDGGYALKQRWL